MQLSRISVRDAAWKSADVIEGSGNVFADLGLPNADQELMKARLTLQTYRIIKDRGITQTEGQSSAFRSLISRRWRAIARATSR